MSVDWGGPVDLYCERFVPGLFAEPLNAVSNLGFVFVGMWLVSNLPRLTAPRPTPLHLNLLAGLIVLIGICSGAFHVFATRWAQALDVASIALFIYTFVICFAHDVLDVRWPFAWMAAPAFWGFGVIVSGPFDPAAFNGSVTYFPALFGIALMGLGLAMNRRPGSTHFGAATAIFLLSISLRSADLALCPGWVWGTHWAWHLLNAAMLLLVCLGLLRASRSP